MKIKSLLPVLFFPFLFACSTDLDVNAPYKDIPVVYGMLNISDSVHYIKVNKAFLGEMDAELMAKYRDSSEYGDILTVIIKEDGNPFGDREFTLERIEVNNKETKDEYGKEGIFYSPTQTLYRFSTGNTPLNEDAEYNLEITNNQNGKVITSSTVLVNDFVVTRPSPSAGFDLVGFAASGNTFTNYEIKFNSAVNGKRYAMEMVMFYIEETATGDSLVKSITWDLGEIKSSDTEGSEILVRNVRGEEFFNRVANVIPELTPGMKRYLYKMDFTFWVAGEELNNYMEINEPSTGIIQERPVYTNIENGIGIYSSRFDKHIKDKKFSRMTADVMSDSPSPHPEFGNRFTHWYGASGPGQPFQFVDLN